MPHSNQTRLEPTGYALIAIGVFKLTKSLLLFGLGCGLLIGRDHDLGLIASHWIDAVWSGRPVFENLLSKLSSINRETLVHVAAGSFFYSALMLIEGVGLCLQKRWAEFLTVAMTASLLPFELFEIYQRVTATRLFIAVVNVAILLYLVHHLWRRQVPTAPLL
jgi:uncharacterized membrane protein (DUF2068 family)